jgi:stringent starvation protein B
MPPTQPLPPKKEVALALLERSSVYVHLDPRQGSVVVPALYKKQAQLVLQVGLNMPVPIKDLQLDDEGMSCTLSFSRTPFFCVVPWSSVFAIIGCDDGRGMVWPDDVPAEVARQADKREPALQNRKEAKPAAIEAAAEAPKPKRPRKRASLGAVPNGDVETTAVSPAPRASEGRSSPRPALSTSANGRAASPTRKKRELPPYLRVVK